MITMVMMLSMKLVRVKCFELNTAKCLQPDVISP